MIWRRILWTVLAVGILFLLNDWQLTAPQPAAQARFFKVTTQGQVLAPWQGPWHCVLDSHTGLLWEVKRDDESIHEGDWTYSWFDGQNGSANQGDCYFRAERCDSADLIVASNHSALCGVTDWRLPTSRELDALRVAQDRAHQPQLAEDYFRFIKDGDYWTADHALPLTGIYQRQGLGARAFNFYQWQSSILPYRNAAFVMLVANAPKPLMQLASTTTNHPLN
ncbi:DUF1566 domain-containing protein [Pseudoalteromonas fenneropenaei]|uniref:DUF1566 domain-containing protein n=1 Tax=Pseudoalteromonas fenneropenaei TaxID=1737459 RepID=A0ABV7CGM2_9GAMM